MSSCLVPVATTQENRLQLVLLFRSRVDLVALDVSVLNNERRDVRLTVPWHASGYNPSGPVSGISTCLKLVARKRRCRVRLFAAPA
jgi:hypothetical protein